MKKLQLLLALIFFARVTQGQIPSRPTTVQSPNAASLGMYGEIPVSLFTGLPSIEVPLHTVQAGPIALPIFLSYHASGFRPELHPGWVGTGWSLNAGGVVSRTIRDLPDEYSNTKFSASVEIGYFFNRALARTDWYTTSTLQSIARSPAQNNKDTEPDEFSFSFNGYSGKFYLNADGHWKVKCNKPLTLTPTVPGQASPFQNTPFLGPLGGDPSTYSSKTFVGFTITAEDGTQYVFGGPTSAIEYEIGMFSQHPEQGGEWIANSWYLTRIIHPDGPEVSLTYEREANEYLAQMYIGLQDNVATRTVASNGSLGPNCESFGVSSIYGSYTGKLIAPVYLTTIQTPISTVHFDRATSTELAYSQEVFQDKAEKNHPNTMLLPYLQYDPGSNTSIGYPQCLNKLKWKKLTQIRVVSKTPAQLVKSFLFSYNDKINERLTLLQVAEQGVGGAAKPPYRFGYNKYHGLPAYLLDQVDHWGFYNANPIVRNDFIKYNSYYAHREANPDSAVYLAGMLTRIVYPTGGVTDFLYEQHRFGKQLAEDRFLPPQTASGTAGGVRIKKVTSYSVANANPEQKLEKEYSYVSGYTPSATGDLPSSGVLGGRTRYYFDDYRGAFNNKGTTYSRSVFSTQSVLPACSNSQGSHIGYSTVVEKRSDGGYSQYAYSNFDTGNLDEFPLTELQGTIPNSRTLRWSRLGAQKQDVYFLSHERKKQQVHAG